MFSEHVMAEGDTFDNDFYARGPVFSELPDEIAVRKSSSVSLSVDNPFLTIWLRPRATIRAIVNHNPRLYVIVLMMTLGVISTLSRATERNLGDKGSLARILGASLILGPLFGVIQVYLFAWLLRVSGRGLGGRADSQSLRAALAWSTVPLIPTIPIWIGQIVIFGVEMFTSKTPNIDASPSLQAMLFASSAIESVFGLWAWILSLKCVGEVQGFSAWRAFGSMILACLLAAAPVLLIVIIFVAMWSGR
jgi:hypothetical protein